MRILKYIYHISPFIAVALTLAFLGWLLSLHGTIGLLHVNFSLLIGFIVIIIVVALLCVLAIWQIFIARKKKPGLKIWYIAPVVLLTIIEIIIPVTAFVYLNTPVSPPTEVRQPQLLLCDSKSDTGLPNIAVVNYTADAILETLTWGTAETSSVIVDNIATQQHVFILNNMAPDTEYWYRINNDTKYYFNTPNLEENTLHFAVASDFHYGAAGARNDLTANMLENISNSTNQYDYLFANGDIVNYGFSETQWHTALQGLAPTISTIPAAIIAGNHDTLFNGLNKYEYYCYPPALNSSSGSQLWHRYDVGEIHFICLDIEWSAECFTDEQAAWLEAELKSIPQNNWIIVIGHGYYYASGSIIDGWKWYDNPETIEKLSPIFEEYGVDIVFSGHVHQLELLQHAGVTYVVTGAFGGVLEPNNTYKSPVSLWYTGEQYGFADITVNENTAEIVFRGSENQVLYSFTLNK